MQEPLFQDLIDALKPIINIEDFNHNTFNYMIHTALTARVVLAEANGVSELNALYALKANIDEHIDNMIMDVIKSQSQNN